MGVFSVIAMFVIMIYIVLMLIVLAAAVLTIIGQWKIFAKAGRPGWAAIVPFYSSYILYDIGNLPTALVSVNISAFVLGVIQMCLSSAMVFLNINVMPIMIFSSLCTCASIACFILSLFANMNIAKKFGKSAGYGVGMTFLPFIFDLMLGCDKNATYSENI